MQKGEKSWQSISIAILSPHGELKKIDLIKDFNLPFKLKCNKHTVGCFNPGNQLSSCQH